MAVDLFGNPYGQFTWRQCNEFEPEELSDKHLAAYIEPVAELFRAAASIGKLDVFAALRKEYLDGLLNINGLAAALKDIQENRVIQVDEYTYGQLREDPALARRHGFVDQPSIKDDQLAIRVETREVGPRVLFHSIYPDLSHISEIYKIRTAKKVNS